MACKELGYDTIPCIVKKLTPEQQLEVCIIASVPYVKTKPEDYKRHLRRLIANNPLLTLPELKEKLNQSSEWLKEQLGFININPKILNKIEDGSIKLINALTLTELPTYIQGDYTEQVINLEATDFVPMVLNKVSELKIASKLTDAESKETDNGSW